MLVSLEDIKKYLQIASADPTYDQFLTDQEQIISDSVEGYCGRKFLLANWVQTFYADDYEEGTFTLPLFHYPVLEINSIVEGTIDLLERVRLHKPTGMIKSHRGFFDHECFFQSRLPIVVTYRAGLEEIPSPVKSVILSLIAERYSKQQSGINLNFGSNVQSVSIPGTISVAFDYTLKANDRITAFGTLLGNYVNVLDSYKSERTVVGTGKLAYVEGQ